MDVTAAARELIEANRYLTLATADAAGRPWASPVWYAHEDDRAFLWVSKPGTRHSHNIAERPEVGIVIFDSTVPVGSAAAVYAEAVAGEVGDDGLDAAIAAFSARSVATGLRPWGPDDVTGSAALRLYRAAVSELSVLGPDSRRLPLAS
jgi:uncharacterized protein YhbP (UPF0306 family)